MTQVVKQTIALLNEMGENDPKRANFMRDVFCAGRAPLD